MLVVFTDGILRRSVRGQTCRPRVMVTDVYGIIRRCIFFIFSFFFTAWDCFMLQVMWHFQGISRIFGGWVCSVIWPELLNWADNDRKLVLGNVSSMVPRQQESFTPSSISSKIVSSVLRASPAVEYLSPSDRESLRSQFQTVVALDPLQIFVRPRNPSPSSRPRPRLQ